MPRVSLLVLLLLGTGVLAVVPPPANAATPLSADEYEQANALFLEKCAGCHGAAREGRGGRELFSALMRERGELAVKQTLHFGTSTGMPNWGTAELLSEANMDLLTRFLLQDPAADDRLEPQRPPLLPTFSGTSVLASHELIVAPEARPRQRENPLVAKDMFVSLLHDTASVALLDAVSKRVVGRVGVGLAPHAVALSPDERYLYVLGRGGELAMLDLFMREPKVVARARVGYEARALAVSGRGRTARLLVAAQVPAQLIVLDLITLQPLHTLSLASAGGAQAHQTDLRVVQLFGGRTRSARFLLVSQAPGRVVVGQLASNGQPKLQPSVLVAEELRAGTVNCARGQSAKSAILPTGADALVVVDVQTGQRQQRLSSPNIDGAALGACFRGPDGATYWAAGSLYTPRGVLLAHDSASQRWSVRRALQMPVEGSLFTASHSRSPNLWLDHPVAQDEQAGGRVSVFNIAQLLVTDTDALKGLAAAAESLAVADLVGLADEPVRVLHPQYNRDGSEIWFTVWNRQDRRSVVAVFDDASRRLKTVIDDSRLITPIRTFSLANLPGGR